MWLMGLMYLLLLRWHLDSCCLVSVKCMRESMNA
jgi:hypothetical protein